MDVSQIRQEYTKRKLSKISVKKNAFEQFDLWLEEAITSSCHEPTAMIVSTVSPQNTPASRVVLLKGVDDGSFVFYTNYSSRKGTHLSGNASIAALFFWPELERQVNIEGRVEKCTTQQSDAYFNSRPWKSRIGAIVSPQSKIIASRTVIKKAFVLEAAKHLGETVPRPEHWGGYRLVPERIEFWQGRPSRLHDRILYTRAGDAWNIDRLAP